MRLLPATAAAIAVASLAALASGLVPAAGSGEDRASAEAGGDGAGEPRLSISNPRKGPYEARAVVETEGEARVKIELRLAGRGIDGKRSLIDRATRSEVVSAGCTRLELPLPGALGSCFGYLRCKLLGMATVSPLTPPVPPATEPAVGEPAGTDSAERRIPTGEPKIRSRHIPYGANRRKQMAAYSERHYGEREWRLEPRGIVEHYTASATAGPALATFIANRPDVEYHELPGVCAHYLIDRDGTILELVPTDTRCRHTVGLNHETIGIEHVGQSDSDVVGRPRVLRASLALTSWLRCAYAIERGNVIGHNESLGSPLYEELDPDFRGRTHGDMKPATMNRYRRALGGC